LFVLGQCQNAQLMAGTLFIVATPIGNLEDITQRALRVLREVDLVACEDTRHTQRLLNHFGIKTRTISYHEHNETERSAELCRLLETGKNIALVSDAGTPLVSDPGFRLVNAAVEQNIPVVTIPGAAAFVTALVASGMPADQFLFAGFLPSRGNARRAKLETLSEVPATLVFYEAPHRLAAALKDAVEVLGNRRAVIARELTKLHEEIARGTLADLLERFSNQSVRGEVVLIIGAEVVGSAETEKKDAPPERLSERVSELEREGVSAKDALKKAARELGMKRAEAYRMMVAQKKRRSK
jgi:16S rRNA (cytidine1402-2'-O)-methyltransferase